jgi:tellurite resistance protein
MIDHHAALIYIMVMASIADSDMTDSEIETISSMVNRMPVFANYDHARLRSTLDECVVLLQQPDGLEIALDKINRNLPPKLRETAYAVACDVVAADGEASQEELRLLEMLRHEISVDRLTAAAIERGARARHTRA